MNRRRKQLLDPNTVVLLKHFFTGLVVLSVVALILTAVWYGTRLKALTINNITVEGGQTINHEEIKSIVENNLDGTYLGLVPRKFAWSYPQSDILTSLSKIERIYNVVVDRTGGTQLQIKFDEYVPQALWCNAVDDESCLFLDDDGYAFAEAPTLSGGTFLRFVKSDESAQLDTTFATIDIYHSLMKLVKLLGKHGWYVSYIETDQVGDAFLQLVGGGELKVVISQSPTQTVDNLFLVLSSEEFVHIKPGNFEYIDLRFGDKVFVKE